MHYERILVPVDGSDRSGETLDETAAVAKQLGATPETLLVENVGGRVA